MDGVGFELVLITHREKFIADFAAIVAPTPFRRMSVPGAPSIACLFNKAIEECSASIVIIACDKSRPKPSDVGEMVGLVNAGYGIVALHGFRFFGAKVDLFRHVGLFDESYLGGSYSDHDMVFRLCEADIAHYETRQVEFVYERSSWSYEVEDSMRERFESHYDASGMRGGVIVRKLDSTFRTMATKSGFVCPRFLPWSRTRLTSIHGPQDYYASSRMLGRRR